MGHWIFLLFFSHSQKLYLTIDRTNWFLGKSKINVLVLGVAYEGVAIPVFWNFMNKAGNATAAEHQAAINRFIEAFGTECIAGILGDREFASSELIGWLNSMEIPFYIRIKEGSLLTIKGNKFCTAAKIFKHLNCKEKHFFGMDVEFGGQKVFLAGSRSEKGELMIIATNRSPKNAISIYLRRWEIENLFQSLKSSSFRFEETHITKLDRLEKLVALLAIGFFWAHKVGEWKAKINLLFIINIEIAKDLRQLISNMG